MQIKPLVTDAVHFWERMRLDYNVGLAVIVAALFFFYYPASAGAFTVDTLLFVIEMAILANVAYCAAYVVDIFFQLSDFAETYKRLRWLLFSVGFVLAAILTRWVMMALLTPAVPG